MAFILKDTSRINAIKNTIYCKSDGYDEIQFCDFSYVKLFLG